MFSRDDFKVESWSDFASFMLIMPFVAFIGPFLLASYTLGFVQDITGWLDS